MRLSAWGKIAREEWVASVAIRQELELDEYVIMPNHMHGIVWLVEPDGETIVHSDLEELSFKGRRAPLKRGAKSLGSFVAGYKARVTSLINKLEETSGFKVWQRNYWEHIIRNDRGLDKIREYIVNNALNWDTDQLHPEAPPNRFKL